MAILRMAGDLPPDLEVELYHETNGETVKWSGRSSGVVERFQGWALVAAGGVLALVNLGGPAATIGLVVDCIERGQSPALSSLVEAASGLILFIAGLGLAFFGWRFLKSAQRVVWAITNRRLIRLIAGGAPPTRSWGKAEILGVERLNWTDSAKRCLAVTIKGRGANNPVLIINGPVDLEAAERALGELEA